MGKTLRTNDPGVPMTKTGDPEEEHGVFQGTVSLEYNNGFDLRFHHAFSIGVPDLMLSARQAGWKVTGLADT